jgi:deferrochelatase/peroxidase EfeB
MINYDKSDLQAGILKGIKKNHCFLISFWCPPSSFDKGAKMKSFLATYAQKVTTADESPSIIRTMALGSVAFERLEIVSPFVNKQEEFAENFLYANSLADRPRLKVGNEFCVLIQLWCDEEEVTTVEAEVEKIRQDLHSADLLSERFFKTVYQQRDTTLEIKDGLRKIRSRGPLGFIEGAGNPKHEEEIVDCCLIDDTNFGTSTFMAFLNCRVNKDRFEKTAEKLAGKIFHGDEEKTGVTAGEKEYGRAQLMGQFSDERENFEERGKAIMSNLHARPDLPEEGYCPFGAHAKLMRNETENSPKNRIVRRGIAYEYEDRFTDLYTSSKEQVIVNRGLYFISYQRCFKEQYISLLKQMQHQDLVMYHKAARSTIEEERKQSPFHYWRKSEEKKFLNESDLRFLTILSEGYYFVPGKKYLTSLASR